MSTPTVQTDAPTVVATAYRWMHRGDIDMARFYLSQLSDVDRVEARMNAVRVAAVLAELSLPPTVEQVAAAALTPDALPDDIGSRNRQQAERALADQCPWCGADPCEWREVHDRLDAMAESTWLRRART